MRRLTVGIEAGRAIAARIVADGCTTIPLDQLSHAAPAIGAPEDVIGPLLEPLFSR